MNVVIIGGGAAGMMAAITSAKEGNQVTLLEKTGSLGNKVKITGKGRCNLTFEGDIEDFKENVVKNSKFMYSSFTQFDNHDVMQFFEDLQVPLKVERGNRVFPVSDQAQDIVLALKKELERLHVKVIYSERVTSLEVIDKKISAVVTQNEHRYECNKCIIATGGVSYPTTGSTGDGYLIAEQIGHHIVDIQGGLVPLKSQDPICKALQGLTLKKIGYRLLDNEKEIYRDFGELLFAHFGLTGPVVLSSSSILNRIDHIENKLKNGKIRASIDLKPALDKETLDKRICRDFEKYSNKEFKNSLEDLLPQKLIPIVIKLSRIPEHKKVHQITKEERENLVKIIKDISIPISGFMTRDMAVITCGGIDIKEVNPKTMESRIISGVYFAGEVLDVDAYTGGYNLQIAFSTAVAAGKNN